MESLLLLLPNIAANTGLNIQLVELDSPRWFLARVEADVEQK